MVRGQVRGQGIGRGQGQGMGRGQGQGQGMGQGQGQGQGSGRGLGGGSALGPGGDCICPSCGFKIPHELGVQCYNKHCPKCGTIMTRGK